MIFFRGFDGASLSIVEVQSGWEIAFRKYIVAPKQCHIEILIKEQLPFSVNFGKIADYCDKHAIDLCSERPDDALTEKQSVAKCGADIEAAKAMFLFVSREILDLSDASRFNSVSSGMSRWSEVIDSPEQMPASRETGLKKNIDVARKSAGVGVLGVVAYCILRLMQIIGTGGIFATVIFERESWDTIIWSEWGLMAEIPLLGLVSTLLVVVSLLAIFSPIYWRVPTGDRVRGLVPIERTPQKLFQHFISQRTNLVTIVVVVFAFFAWFST